MKQYWLAAGLVMAPLHAGVLVNGGFEDGLNGWTINQDSGSVSIVSQYVGNPYTYNPKEGSHFLEIVPGSSRYVVAAQQSVDLSASTKVSGWAGFNKGTEIDMMEVQVSKDGGATWDQVQYWDSNAYSSVNWTQWNYTATTTGNYTFRFMAENIVGSGSKSVGVFDGVTVVPEPGSAAIVGTILLGGVLVKRRFSKQNR